MYKALLLHLDPGENCKKRTNIAIELARKYEAHLVGLYYVHPLPMPGYVRPELQGNYLTTWKDSLTQDRERAAAAFHELVSRAGISFEWRFEQPLPNDGFETHARYADLAIVGQTNPDAAQRYTASDFPEFVCLSAGRPVLVVPYAGEFGTVGERVLVAWNASREATRAVADAMPILRRAKKVFVLSVNPAKEVSAHGDVPGADIAWYLARHGVKVEATDTSRSDGEAGDTLLSCAFDHQADLIVMGAYGHSRFKEMVLGGMTRTLLGEMTVPVFMSH